jgi:hypothetical protein
MSGWVLPPPPPLPEEPEEEEKLELLEDELELDDEELLERPVTVVTLIADVLAKKLLAAS